MFTSFLSSQKSTREALLPEVEAKLSQVLVPELDQDIISLKCLRDVRVVQKHMTVDLVLPTFALKSEKEVAFAAKKALLDCVPAGFDVTLNVFADVKPATEQSLNRPGVYDVRNIVLVASGKGGVGKSTVAANLALSLKSMGCRVGLLDADVYGPSVPTMFGVPDSEPVGGVQVAESKESYMVPIEREGIKLMSVGFLVDTNEAMIWRGPMIASASMQMFQNVVWGDLDYLIVDLPPGTGDIQLTISQRVRVAGAVIVSTPQQVALADVIRAKAMFDKVNIPILGVVENMSYFVCDSCTSRHEIFSNGGAKQIATTLSLPFLGELPLDPRVREGCDKGMTLAGLSASEPVKQAFEEVAHQVATRIAIMAEERVLVDLPQIEITQPAKPNKTALPVLNA